MTQSNYRELQCKSALNRVSGMHFGWSLNPYQGCFHSCVYCFARHHAQLADRDPGEGFSANIGVKINIVEQLRKELSRKSWKGESVVLGTATDPYQPIEGRYKLTRGCLLALRDYRTPVQIITKGTLIVRDLDVLVELAKRAKVSVSFSVPTVDETVWKKTEPGTSPPLQRLRVLKQLVEAGVEAGVGMAPLLPGISDSPSQLEATVMAAAKARACFVWAGTVYLKPGTREHFFRFMKKELPHLLQRYEQIFFKPYAPKSVTIPVQEKVREFKKQFQVRDRRLQKLKPPEKPIQLQLI